MDLQKLAKLKANSELQIVPKFITKKNIIRSRELLTPKTHDCFGIEITDEKLKTGVLEIPVLPNRNMMMHTFEYEKKVGGKTIPINFYPYRNLVRYRVVYQKVNLLKIVYEFGIETLNTSENMYPKEYIFEEFTQEIYLKYSYTRGQWYKPSQAEWDAQYKKIQAALKSDEWDLIVEAYEGSPDIDIEINENEAYMPVIERCKQVLDITKSFFEHKNLFGEINNLHFELLKTHIIRSLERYEIVKATIQETGIKTHRKEFSNVVESTKLLYSQIGKELANLQNAVKTCARESGYWFDKQTGDIYPNAGEFYALSQLSKENRNQNTQELLKTAIVSLGSPYVELSDAKLQNKVAELKKKQKTKD